MFGQSGQLSARVVGGEPGAARNCQFVRTGARASHVSGLSGQRTYNERHRQKNAICFSFVAGARTRGPRVRCPRSGVRSQFLPSTLCRAETFEWPVIVCVSALKTEPNLCKHMSRSVRFADRSRKDLKRKAGNMLQWQGTNNTLGGGGATRARPHRDRT